VTDASSPVSVTYQGGGKQQTIPAELLIIACDPRALVGITGTKVMEPSPKEAAIFGAFTEYVFQTTLVTVKVPSNPPQHGAILDPYTVSQMAGDVSAFRNETAKQYSLAAANTLEENHLVVYQEWSDDSPKPRPDKATLLSTLKDQLNDPVKLPWWPYGTDWTIGDEDTDVLHSSYFHHFRGSDVEGGLPWHLLDLQGANNTAYTWAGTCFESALQCWQYQEHVLFSKDNLHAIQLPKDPKAPIVIVGAGVSGVLMADRLTRLMGRTNVTLLEKTGLVGGKTHSIVRQGPRPQGNPEPTICELGTCYMSPAYDEFHKFLKPFWSSDPPHGENFRRAFPPNPPGEFRGMVTTGTMSWKNPKDPNNPVIDYTDYIVLRYQQIVGDPPDPSKRDEVLALIAGYLGDYWERGTELIGQHLPMPLKRLGAKKMTILAGTYQDWIDSSGEILPAMSGLTGVLEYAYSNQGYGPLKKIPAYYGLVWVSPLLAQRLVTEAFTSHGGVTTWSKGWGDIWTRMAKPLKILTNVEITSIKRNLTSEE